MRGGTVYGDLVFGLKQGKKRLSFYGKMFVFFQIKKLLEMGMFEGRRDDKKCFEEKWAAICKSF